MIWSGLVSSTDSPVGRLLLAKGDRPIVEQSRKDDFCGAKVAEDGSLGGMNVLGLVLGNASRVIGTGVVIGLTLAFVFAHTVASLLFGVEPRDPVTFAMVGAVLVLTAMAACAVPALRAVRVDPVETFRSE